MTKEEVIALLQNMVKEMPEEPFMKDEYGKLSEWETGYMNALGDFKNHIEVKIREIIGNIYENPELLNGKTNQTTE